MDSSDAIRPISVTERRGAISREVLESLPEWFGIPASVENYITAADELRMTIKSTRELGCSTRLLVFSRLRNSRPCGGLRTHVYLCFDCYEGGAPASGIGAEVAVLCPRVR